MSDEPAFPSMSTLGGEPVQFSGASLRDYFAAKAMQGMVSSIDSEENYRRLRGHAKKYGLSVSQWIARDAYKQADRMLEARNSQKEPTK